MHHLQTEILIDATPQAIWNVLMDFESYPGWNPFIISIEGRAQVGQSITARLQPPGQKVSTFSPTVQVVEPQKEFRWEGKLFIKGLFDGQHYFQMEPVGENQTRFIHGEYFKGLLVRPLMRMIGEATRLGFEAMNHALAERVRLVYD